MLADELFLLWKWNVTLAHMNSTGGTNSLDPENRLVPDISLVGSASVFVILAVWSWVNL